MLYITLPDGSQVAVSYDREGQPMVNHRLTPGAMWDPLPASAIDARVSWDRLILDGAVTTEARMAAAKRIG